MSFRTASGLPDAVPDRGIRAKRGLIIRSLLKTLSTIFATGTILLDALDSTVDDYEYAVMEVSVMKTNIDYIIFRDLQDFKRSRVPSLTAPEYIADNKSGRRTRCALLCIPASARAPRLEEFLCPGWACAGGIVFQNCCFCGCNL